MTLLYLVAAWAAGIFLSSFASSPAGTWLALAAGSVCLAYLFRRNRLRRLSLICAALFALGAGRYAWARRPLPADHIALYVDSGYVTLTGVVDRDPDVRDRYVNLYVRAESLRQDSQDRPAQGLALVQAPRYGSYAYGDRVTASGQLLTPPEFDDFSYRDYLARRGVRAIMPDAQVDVLAHHQGRPWYAAMYALKGRAQRTINRLLPSPQAPLLDGILLGVESGIPEDVREAFNRTGTSHVIAISGANIIVVIRVLMGLLKPPLGERRAGWVTLAGVGFYTILVGADPAVVRAAIMGSMALLAAQWGRRAYGLTLLAFAIWLMTLWNPLTLWDIGFQLSVAATAGLVLFSDTFTKALERALKRGFAQDTARQITQWLAEPVVVSLAAQITTTPLILVYFGRLSVVSFLANILIVPAQAYIMTMGWLGAMLGMVWPLIGEPLAWIVWIPLTYTLEIVRQLGKLEWASMNVDFPTSYAWGVYTALLGIALVIIQHPEDRALLFRSLRRRLTAYMVIVCGAILAVLAWATALSQPDGRLHVWFLDVGDGNAILVQTPRGANILIDGGPNPTRLRRGVGDALPFWDRSLDMLIITQPKNSVIDALPALLDRYEIKSVLTNGQTGDSDSYEALARLWQARGTRVLAVSAGYRLVTGDHVTLEILHPQVLPVANADIEDASMVIRVSFGDASFLITSDLSARAEDIMLRAGWYIGSTVLMLPAHGSPTANTAVFLRAAQPQVAVATVGAGNRSGLPAPETVEMLREVTSGPLYRTDQQGTVEMTTDGHMLWIATERR
ncbi:MAG TPA: ComEC/Rec2 family competence protein [Aggregatilineaceae bacterium]|nr:ComEC/Rec2 family competence protein [Aggregatilineaceae bacterium]